ncbi:MAG TPA: cytochrome c oxidase assembly protein [Actinomycetospora sp.]|uniref:cytochrome c oxidase assembly protein n=1 Tax=Actinomycetospora sp. TaxID=1872135 RepID=UPI002F3E8747
MLTTWHTTWGVEVVATALAALYLRNALHVTGWPVIRTVSAIGALAVVVVTVDSGLGAAVSRSFAVGVVVQLLLSSVVPPLWVAGRPGELLRRGWSERVSAALDRLRAVVRAATAAPTVLVVYALVVVLTRLTAFPVAVATNPVLGVLEQLLWLGAGLMVFSTALGAHRAAAGLLLLTGAAAVTTAGGLVLAAVPAVLVPAFSPDDVHRGGTILWAAGGGLVLVIVAALGCRWAMDRPSRARSGRCPVH